MNKIIYRFSACLLFLFLIGCDDMFSRDDSESTPSHGSSGKWNIRNIFGRKKEKKDVVHVPEKPQLEQKTSSEQTLSSPEATRIPSATSRTSPPKSPQSFQHAPKQKPANEASGTTDLLSQENVFFVSQGFVVGKFLTKTFPGKSVLVFCDPDFLKTPRARSLQIMLQSGGVTGEIAFATPKFSAKSDNTTEEGLDSDRLSVEEFDRFLNENKNCGVIISLIGLPPNAAAMKFWSMPSQTRPKIVLIGYSEMRGLPKAIERGWIHAVVTVSPKAVFSAEAPPQDPQEAFDKRYILVTQDNIQEYKRLFP